MNCKKFVRGFGFTILTLLTIGSTVALFGLSTYYIYKFLDGVSDGFIAGIIVALCVSFLVFCFGIYASCKGTKCTRSVLAVIYILYAIFVGAMAIFFLAFKNKILTLIGDQYNKENNELVESINKAFNCNSWEGNQTVNTTVSENTTLISCKEKIEKFYNKTQLVIGIILIAVFLILVVGIILVFKYICCSAEDSTSSKERLSTPLTYGW